MINHNPYCVIPFSQTDETLRPNKEILLRSNEGFASLRGSRLQTSDQNLTFTLDLSIWTLIIVTTEIKKQVPHWRLGREHCKRFRLIDTCNYELAQWVFHLLARMLRPLAKCCDPEAHNRDKYYSRTLLHFIWVRMCRNLRVRGSVVGWGTMLQAGRSRVRFPMRSLDISIDLIVPGALYPRGLLNL
jgi:hypothetical protein